MSHYGGGAQTNINGKNYEASMYLVNDLNELGYDVIDSDVYDQDMYLGTIFAQGGFYNWLAEEKGVDYTRFCSKKYLPDDGLYDAQNNILFIFEKKFQEQPGSVDEKVQTGPFKLYQYQKLAQAAGIYDVKFCYVLYSNYYNSPKFDDVWEYYQNFPDIYIFFDTFGLSELGF